MNPPTVEELRAKCGDFLTMMSVSRKNQTRHSQSSGYQKPTHMTNDSTPNAKDAAQSSNSNWTQAPKSKVINLSRNRGNRECILQTGTAPLKCFHCQQEGNMKPNFPVLKGSKPNVTGQSPRMTDNSKEIEALKQQLVAARNDANRNATPQVVKTDLDGLRTEFRNQISNMRREIMEAIGRNARQSHVNTADAVRTEDERQAQVMEQRTPCGGCCTSQAECTARVECTQRSDNLKILELSERRQLTVPESAGHQDWVGTHQSIVSFMVYVAYFRKLGHDVDERSIAQSLKANRSVTYTWLTRKGLSMDQWMLC